MKSIIKIVSYLLIFAFAANAYALGEYDGHVAPSWESLDRAFKQLFFYAQREIEYQRREGTPRHVYAAFVFCDDGTRTYKYARCWNERSEEEALKTAKKYLATLGQCRGAVKSFAFDQWKEEHTPIPRLSDYTSPPKTPEQVFRERRLMVQAASRRVVEEKIREHNKQKALMQTGKQLHDWGIQSVKLQEEYEALLKKQAREREEFRVR